MFVGSDKSKLVPLYGQEIAALQAWSFLRGENSVRGKNGDMISVHEAILDECLEEGKGYITAS
jgi:hypothetical protein